MKDEAEAKRIEEAAKRTVAQVDVGRVPMKRKGS